MCSSDLKGTVLLAGSNQRSNQRDGSSGQAGHKLPSGRQTTKGTVPLAASDYQGDGSPGRVVQRCRSPVPEKIVKVRQGKDLCLTFCFSRKNRPLGIPLAPSLWHPWHRNSLCLTFYFGQKNRPFGLWPFGDLWRLALWRTSAENPPEEPSPWRWRSVPLAEPKEPSPWLPLAS
mgnify:CR=1 FL=1